jgi:hypothetical protein
VGADDPTICEPRISRDTDSEALGLGYSWSLVVPSPQMSGRPMCLTCKRCGEPFTQARGRPRLYCGQCRAVVRLSRRICASCDEWFDRTNGRQRFCPKCRDAYGRGELRRRADRVVIARKARDREVQRLRDVEQRASFSVLRAVELWSNGGYRESELRAVRSAAITLGQARRALAASMNPRLRDPLRTPTIGVSTNE